MVEIVKMDAHINEPVSAETAVSLLLRLFEKTK